MTGPLDEVTRTQMGAVLEEGVETLSLGQIVTFTRYTRQVLPIDGYVFWVKSSLLGSPPSPLTLDARGSLHYATSNYQLEDENFSLNQVVFSSLDEVTELNDVEDGTLWLAEFEEIRFSFSARAAYYKQTSLFHYRGDAVYPAMASQIIDALPVPTDQIVTNSLPIWLALRETFSEAMGLSLDIYPSYLVPSNLAPPYAVVHVVPEGTVALAAMPYQGRAADSIGTFVIGESPIGARYRNQLCRDRVRITLYGINNEQAMDFIDVVNTYSVNYDDLGIMNMPVVRDEKRAQNEMNVLAQKKTIEYEVSYYQTRAAQVALKLIEQCTPTINVVS